MHEGAAYRIERIIDFDCVVATDAEHGHTKVLRIAELTAVAQKSSADTEHGHVIDALGDDERKVAYDRLEKIKPLLDQGKFGRADVERRAREVGCSTNTLYRWIKRYRASHDYTTLVPGKSGWRKGASRLTPQADAIIREAIDGTYDPDKKAYARKPAIRIIEEVRERCLKKGLTTPSDPTIRARIARVTGRRRGKKTHERRAVQAHQLEESLWDHVEAALSKTQWSDHAAEITRRMALADEFEPAGVVHHWARAVSRGDSREAQRLVDIDDDLRSPLCK